LDSWGSEQVPVVGSCETGFHETWEISSLAHEFRILFAGCSVYVMTKSMNSFVDITIYL